MRYIYYIIGIFILLTLGLLLRLNGFNIKVSEPALVINDRIISKSELDEFAKIGSYHSRGEGFLDAVITRELLIQEAIKEGVNDEESFRKSVEAYYEQSLIKTLIDRKQQSFSPEVTNGMVAAYERISPQKVTYTRFLYASEADRLAGNILLSSQQTHFFEDLSESLKFILYPLKAGDSSAPVNMDEGIVVCRMDRIEPEAGAVPEPDTDQIESFLFEQMKIVMFEAWLDNLRQAANIEDLSQSTGGK